MRRLAWIPTASVKLDRGPLGPSVFKLACHLARGKTVPPIHVQAFKNGSFLICDGRHRVQAHRLLGREYILARYSQEEPQYVTEPSNFIG